MKQEELNEIIARHGAWLRGEEGGERADLHGADLRWANLSEADLREADLRWANLSEADLREADLRWANLRWANLRGAKDFFLLPAQDPRGHSFGHAVLCGDQWKIRAGCRDFTIDEAREHWGEKYGGDREIGDMYLYAVDWLEKKIAGGE